MCAGAGTNTSSTVTDPWSGVAGFFLLSARLHKGGTISNSLNNKSCLTLFSLQHDNQCPYNMVHEGVEDTSVSHWGMSRAHSLLRPVQKQDQDSHYYGLSAVLVTHRFCYR